MKTKKIWASLLMAALLLALPAAAAQVGLRITQETGDQQVVLTGLPAECCGVQLTLTVSGEQPLFQFDSQLEGPGSYAAARQEGNSLTLYLTSKAPLTDTGVLTLGQLTQGTAERECSGLKLLDGEGQLIYEEDRLTGEQESQTQPPAGGSQYAIRVLSASGGQITASLRQAARGAQVELTAIAQTGWQLDRLTVLDETGAQIALSGGENGRYTFRMPGSAVQVAAVFRQVNQTGLPFSDVPAGAWYESAVDYVYRTGLMNGVSAGRFAPGQITTRGMIVTILHRMEGEPQSAGSDFPDVAADAYCRQAVGWAAANGIVNGYGDGRFGPNDPITREQLAVILYRYAGYRGQDRSARGDLSAFRDRDRIGEYAREAVAWANGCGLMNGVGDGLLSPGGSATRAEAAALLTRFAAQMDR